MTKEELFDICPRKLNDEISHQTKHNWDKLSKPLDGMGDFEEIICRVAMIQNSICPDISDRVLLVFCADNGIVSEGVTQSDIDVTKKVAIALGKGVSAACILAQNTNTKVIPIDVGINCTESIEGVMDRKIAHGTKDFMENPAMSEEELLAAIETGINLVQKLKNEGIKLIATGEMGIGNTTTSAAVLAALLNIDSSIVVGRGAGLDDKRLATKKRVVEEGISKYKPAFDDISSFKEKSFEMLRYLGGLDIAAMCGVFIGGARYGMPIVIDGVISSVAALCADRIVEGARSFMLASHSGKEAGTLMALEELSLKPIINANMALGEGTGALMVLSLLDNALYLYNNGIRFDDTGIEDYERFD